MGDVCERRHGEFQRRTLRGKKVKETFNKFFWFYFAIVANSPKNNVIENHLKVFDFFRFYFVVEAQLFVCNETHLIVCIKLTI